MRLRIILLCVVLLMSFSIGLLSHPTAEACGGLFCQNVPVDQQGERIIFTMNGNGTISAYVQINYVGAAPDFSWVVPVPSVPEVDVADIAMFNELGNLTAPQYIPPPMPENCNVAIFRSNVAQSNSPGGVGFNETNVTVLAEGDVGPYSYSVVDSPDPDALIIWLRDNDYRVTEEMEPLVHVYNAEGMVFLAMKLQPESGVQDIQPVKMTYDSELPMIPLRLTAVAATPNMRVLTWVFGDEQAVPINYENPTINDTDIRFFRGGQPHPFQPIFKTPITQALLTKP